MFAPTATNKIEESCHFCDATVRAQLKNFPLHFFVKPLRRKMRATKTTSSVCYRRSRQKGTTMNNSPSTTSSSGSKGHYRSVINKNSNHNHGDNSKKLWEDTVLEDSSDLEDSWAGEEVMFDGSPSSGW